MRIAKIDFDEVQALQLYKAGANDTAIAAAVGTKWQNITKWRNRNNLPSNVNRGRKSRNAQAFVQII